MALLMYLPMMASGVFIAAPGTLLAPSLPRLAQGCALGLVLGFAVVGASWLITQRTAWGRHFLEVFQGMLGRLDSRQILLLALASSLGEEILFRGVLHPRLGLWITALMFGALHMPMRREMWPWTVFAMAMGLVLGLLTDYSQTLWPAIVLHFVVNYFNLHHISESAPPAPPPSSPPSPPHR